MTNYQAGISTLLDRCIRIKPQQRLLIIGEPDRTGYYEDGICELIAKQAKGNDADVTVIKPSMVSGPDDIDPSVSETIHQADHPDAFSME